MSSAKPQAPGANQPAGSLPPDSLPGEAFPPNALPENAVPPGAIPEGLLGDAPMPGAGSGNVRMKEMPRMNARPYLKRAIKLLNAHKGIVAVSLTLSLIMTLLPFLAAAAIGPLFKLFGKAAESGDWSKVWGLTASFYDVSNSGSTDA